LLIEQSKQRLAINANPTISYLYWQIGKRINQEVLNNEMAEYGKQIVVTVSQELVNHFGNGFEEANLRRMMQFAQIFNDKEILVLVIRELTWTHFIAFIPIKDELQR